MPDYLVFVVDDDKISRLLVDSMLRRKYAVETFESAESCLERLAQRLPDLFLLDVGLPGMDGYALCRALKDGPETRDIPVLFVSAHDDLDSVLAGYEAGGEDYFIKPFDVISLHHRIENLQRIEQDKKALAEPTTAADELATLLMANLDEYAVLIKFLRTLNECNSYAEVVDAIRHVLEAFHLDGCLQIRQRNLEQTFGREGGNWPMEAAVINHVRSLGRIFEFRQHAAYNFDRLTILVTNMPIKDADLCGRVRDNLAIAAESADAKLKALQYFEDNATMRGEIRALLAGVGQSVETFSHNYDHARYAGSVHTTQTLDDLLAALAHLGMTAQQEQEIIEMVKDRANKLSDLYDIAGETRTALGAISKKLERILAEAEQPVGTKAAES